MDSKRERDAIREHLRNLQEAKRLPQSDINKIMQTIDNALFVSGKKIKDRLKLFTGIEPTEFNEEINKRSPI